MYDWVAFVSCLVLIVAFWSVEVSIVGSVLVSMFRSVVVLMFVVLVLLFVVLVSLFAVLVLKVLVEGRTLVPV